MTRRLFLLLGQRESDLVRWAIASGPEVLDFGAVEGAGGLATLAPYTDDVGEIVALLPGEKVACRRMPSAPKSAGKLKAAAVYLMEDELAEATGALHVGAAASPALAVAFAARAEIVRGWRAAFEAASLDIDTLSADYLALSSTIEEATVVADGDRVVAAFAGVGFAIEKEQFRALAADLFAAPPSVFRLIGEETLTKSLPETSAVDWLGPGKDAAVLAEYARALNAKAPPNFLERRFVRKKALAGVLGPWRRAAALAAGLAAAALVATAADGIRFARAEAAWNASAKMLHTQRFPEAASADAVEHARKRLAAGGDDASFLLISSRIAATAEKGGDVEIDRVRYDAARGDFIVSVRSKSDAAIETFKTELASAGVAADDSGGFRKNGEAWTGDLKARLQ